MNIPSVIKPIAETNLMRRSYSLPKMLKSLRNHNDMESRRAHVDAHNAPLKLIFL